MRKQSAATQLRYVKQDLSRETKNVQRLWRAIELANTAILVGKGMANCCYAISNGHQLTDHDRKVMGELQRDWDSALSRFRGALS